MNTTFYLVRHRESEKNVLWIHHSCWVDKYPLTANGKSQAQDLCILLRERLIDCVYSSPYLRCIQTIEPILHERNLKWIVDMRITEIDVGRLDGILVWNTWPSDRKLTRDPIWEVWESLHACQERVWNFLNEIKERHKWKSVLISSHGEPLLFAKQYFLGFDYNNSSARDSQYPAKDGFDECIINESGKLISHISYWKPQI